MANAAPVQRGIGLNRWLRLAIGVGFGAAVVWTMGFAAFVRAIPDTVSDPDTRTDAIVVLTGGSERLNTGLRLLADRKAARMFISGVHQDVTVGDLLETAEPIASGLSDRIDVGHGASDTAGNAAETAAWMGRSRFRTLRLVTASYHMPRSLLELRFSLPGATIVPHPVFPSHVRMERWWLWPGTTGLIVTEYNKLLFAWTRQAVTTVVKGT